MCDSIRETRRDLESSRSNNNIGSKYGEDIQTHPPIKRLRTLCSSTTYSLDCEYPITGTSRFLCILLVDCCMSIFTSISQTSQAKNVATVCQSTKSGIFILRKAAAAIRQGGVDGRSRCQRAEPGSPPASPLTCSTLMRLSISTHSNGHYDPASPWLRGPLLERFFRKVASSNSGL